ncbi:MAG: aminoacyl-tRNA hydrolase [Deltaproteobacteria bacterium]|nr:aminoacyl-tRNA hydrolase [Deltaproteobacteria bacterium]
MRLIVGLGNPGRDYENNRHNVGFMAVDAFVHELGETWKFWGPGKNSEVAQASIDGEKIIFQKPLTFMNLSGQAVVAAATFFKVLPEDICAVHDDLDLPFGEVRLKAGGGDGGHNGLKSLTKALTSPDYARVRMGIGRPPHPGMDAAAFVLQDFSNSEFDTVDAMIGHAIQGMKAFAGGGEKFRLEMNTLNRFSGKE